MGAKMSFGSKSYHYCPMFIYSRIQYIRYRKESLTHTLSIVREILEAFAKQGP